MMCRNDNKLIAKILGHGTIIGYCIKLLLSILL